MPGSAIHIRGHRREASEALAPGLGHRVDNGSSYSHQVRAARVRIDRHSRFSCGIWCATDEWVAGDRFAARLVERGGKAFERLPDFLPWVQLESDAQMSTGMWRSMPAQPLAPSCSTTGTLVKTLPQHPWFLYRALVSSENGGGSFLSFGLHV